MRKFLFVGILSSLILFTMTTGLSGLVTSDTASWTTGGPYGGYVNSLAMAATNPDVAYAGTDGGVFKTTDGGDTWTRTGFPNTLVWVVQVAPDDPHIVYAGTFRDGIYKSEDGGSTWTQKGLSGATVNTIAIDPNNLNILYAGTGEPLTDYSGEVIGIFKSTDGGKTWQEKHSVDGVVALLIDVDNSSYIYAGVSGYNDGLRKSTDGGETWGSIHVQADSGNYEDVYALAMTPTGSDPAAIYAITSGGLYNEYVHKSTDRGETWTATDAPGRSPALAVDPNDPNVIYAGRNKSTDGGDTWSMKANGLPPGGLSSIVIDPRNSDVYVGLSESGVYKSTDGAESWNSSSQGMNNTFIEDLAIHPSSSDTVFAAIKGDGHYLAATTNGGSSWGYLDNSNTDLSAVAIDPQNPSTIYVGKHRYFSYHYIYKSVNGGQDWTSINFLHCSYGCAVTVIDILIGVNDSDNILVAARNYGGVLVRTTDGGGSWSQLDYKTTALAADPNDPGIVYAGKANLGYVNRYTNVWGNWRMSDITPSGGIGNVRDIEVDLDSRVYVAAVDSLWRWDGAGWIILTGLPTGDITALAIDRSTSPGIVYVGTGVDGVFVSEDGGDTWKPLNEGLGNLSITKLAISASQPKMLYAGTAYGGVWEFAIAPSIYEIYLPLTLKNY